MKTLIYLKIATLVLMLAGVLYVMTGVSKEKIEQTFLALGVAPGPATAPGLQPGNRAMEQGEKRFNLCPTRIHAIVWNDGRKVEELRQGLKLRWMAHDPQPREISYLAVEKWLSRHCTIAVRLKEGGEPAAEKTPFLVIQFINQTEMKILKLAGGGFAVDDGPSFQSPDFEEALVELEEIAVFETKPAS